MKVAKSVYNVLTIDIDSAITPGTPVIVGTNMDYEMIKKCTAKSGILKVNATIGGAAMCGTLNVNPWAGADKLECTCVTAAGGEISAIVATIEPTDSGMLCTLTKTAI